MPARQGFPRASFTSPWLRRMLEAGYLDGEGGVPLYQYGVLYACCAEKSDRPAAVYMLSRALALVNSRRLSAKEGKGSPPSEEAVDASVRRQEREEFLTTGEIVAGGASALAVGGGGFILLCLAGSALLGALGLGVASDVGFS